jgi:hypothetical protein
MKPPNRLDMRLDSVVPNYASTQPSSSSYRDTVLDDHVFGRAGRRGERVKSTIVVGGREYGGLESVIQAHLTIDDPWMREFIVTDRYRPSVSSCLMDRRERKANCEQVGVLRNHGRRELVSCTKVTAKYKTYSGTLQSCNFLTGVHSCCFVCSVPGDWCVDYGGGLRCGLQDSVVPVCLAGWGVTCSPALPGLPEPRRVVKSVCSREIRRMGGVPKMAWWEVSKERWEGDERSCSV